MRYPAPVTLGEGKNYLLFYLTPEHLFSILGLPEGEG